MGNPSSGCTVQVPMSLSKRRHRQSLSLQLEQLGQLGGIDSCDKKKSVSALSSPKVTEEKSIASFLGSKQVPRKPSSLSGTEDYLKGIELAGGASSTEDRKPISFNPFRGHRSIGSGSIITSCKSLESTPRGKGGSSSFRKEGGSSSFRKEGGSSSFRKEGGSSSFRKEGGSSSFRKEGGSSSFRKEGGSLSFRKDKYAVAKIAASLFHSPVKLERSISMSRVAHKAIPEEVVSLRQRFQRSSDDGYSQTTSELGGDKESGSDTSAKDMEESARPLISNASSLQHECLIGITETLTGEGEAELLSTTTIEDPPSFTADASVLPSVHSQVFVNAAERVSRNLSLALLAGTTNDELLHTEQSSCSIDHNPYGWTRNFSLSNVTRTDSTLQSSSEKYCSSLELAECNSESCADASPGPSSIGSQSSRMAWANEGLPETSILSSSARPPLGSFHSEPDRVLLPMGADSSEKTLEEKIATGDIQSLLFATEKVTEEELTEAAVLSSLMSEEYLSSPVFISSEGSQQNLLTSDSKRHTQLLSPGTKNETGLMKTCNSDACLKKCMSFEPVARDKSKAEGDRKAKLRKRRRSVSASGIGAMLLKVVRVSDSGPIITRRLPKVGPEVISGADALRAREYVLQKTAQISMGRGHESSSPASTPGICQCESEDAVKSTESKFVDIELGSGGDCVELVQHPKDTREGVDGTGCGVASTCEPRQRNQQTASERLSEMIPRHLPDLKNANSESACAHKGMTPTLVEMESYFHGRVERVNSNLQQKTKSARFVSASANTSAAASAVNADERRGGKPRKKSRSKGRSNSFDLDSLTECPKTANSKQAALSTLDANVAISRERSRSFVSRLQAPSGMASVDVFHLAPSSISILANPSFSSSHQDRLWEEQAEAYSSGGRGTPGREDEAAAANVFLHSPSPGAPISSDDHQVPSASASLRRGLINSSTVGTASTLSEEKGRHKRKGQGKKRGRPHTPLRSLLADDVHSKRSGCATRASPEGGHFIQQIMSRIRGSSSKSLSPKSPDAMPKRRNTWSSCICFSIK